MKRNTKIVNAHLHFGNISLISGTRHFFSSLGIRKLSIVSPASLLWVNANPQALCFKVVYPRDVYIMGGLDYTDITLFSPAERKATLAEQLLRLERIGFDGVKILETKPNLMKLMPFSISDCSYRDFFAGLEEKQWPVFWHMADPPEFWDREKIHPLARKYHPPEAENFAR